jgi:5-methyltetrahydropteroyltriglutamate--homocysteine methyltransferase
LSQKNVVLGLVTSKFPTLEDAEIIKRRLKEASEDIPLENLSLSPQCCFASTEEEQWNKIKHVIKISQDVWRNN